MPTIQANALETYYEVVGSGPALLLLHGWGNTWEAWLPIVPALADHFTLIMPDLPGCGLSATPKTGWSTEEYSQWLTAFVAHTPETKFLSAAAGHSFGGKILIWNVSQAGGIPLKKLILIDASGIPVPFTLSQRVLTRVVSLVPISVRHKIGPAIRKRLYVIFGVESDYVAANSFGRLTLQRILKEDLTEKLSKILQPTLLIWGKHDTSTPMWQGDSMHTLIPLNKLIAFDTGHFPHHTFAPQVVKEISDFLTSL